jgi:predicted phosphodiesterase
MRVVRIALISDVHGNDVAFAAALSDVDLDGVLFVNPGSVGLA